ncbi:MAG: FkbM family methyltransferase [Ruminococcaceae bacterium]|nr:FkbM family methyltransferase [Oscillospiraceae bacterium]
MEVERTMNFTIQKDLWEHLASTEKTVVMYGMGNGADKILRACEEKGITVSDFFASDGFVRGHSFHGKTVKSWSEIKELYGAEKVIVLLSFGSSRPEVLENIERIAAETELYAPDVPAFGDGLFDRAFFEAHLAEIERTYALLSDEESKMIFENVLQFKLTGDIRFLQNAVSDEEQTMREMVQPEGIKIAADLGAYNGDTARKLLESAEGNVQRIYAMEPDARNYRKLKAYAEEETRAEVIPVNAGAWSEKTILYFDDSGNRNASFGSNRSESLSDRPVKLKAVEADTLDNILDGEPVDYIKYDVEGSEKEALLGSKETIEKNHPTLLVSLYHRNEDLFALPLLVKDLFPEYQGFYLRRFAGVPAWDLNLYVKK